MTREADGFAPRLKRFNDGVARGEAALAMAMLLLMLVVAFAQAFLRNMTMLGFEWANAALEHLDWADFVLSKGTLWLAFLGASLAVHKDKHISIDIVPRLVSPRARIVMRGLVGIIGSVICFYLARAFWAAVMINGEERPPEMEILTATGSAHVCDGSAADLAQSGVSRPGFFCAVRAGFRAINVVVETPGAAFQLITPVMLVFMAARMLASGIDDFVRLAKGDLHDDPGAHGITGAASDVANELSKPEGHGK